AIPTKPYPSSASGWRNPRELTHGRTRTAEPDQETAERGATLRHADAGARRAARVRDLEAARRRRDSRHFACNVDARYDRRRCGRAHDGRVRVENVHHRRADG